MNHLYQHSPGFLIPFLHPGITWVSSLDNRFRTGREEVSEALAAFKMPAPCLIPTLTFHMLCFDQSSCTALCTCATVHQQMHCITFVWKIEHGCLRLLHIHGSLTPKPAPDFTAPEIGNGTDTNPVLVFTGRRAEKYYLRPSDIFYVEADNVSAHLICADRTVYICQTISMAQELLPDCFLKIHRSFLVNLHYIVSLRRYTVELLNGAALPVPEKKYKWLKEYLDRYRETG